MKHAWLLLVVFVAAALPSHAQSEADVVFGSDRTHIQMSPVPARETYTVVIEASVVEASSRVDIASKWQSPQGAHQGEYRCSVAATCAGNASQEPPPGWTWEDLGDRYRGTWYLDWVSASQPASGCGSFGYACYEGEGRAHSLVQVQWETGGEDFEDHTWFYATTPPAIAFPGVFGTVDGCSPSCGCPPSSDLVWGNWQAAPGASFEHSRGILAHNPTNETQHTVLAFRDTAFRSSSGGAIPLHHIEIRADYYSDSACLTPADLGPGNDPFREYNWPKGGQALIRLPPETYAFVSYSSRAPLPSPLPHGDYRVPYTWTTT